jgi:hypothetical protein
MLACRLVLATRFCSSAISTERSASTAMSSVCRCASALKPTRSSRPRVRSSRGSRAASCPGDWSLRAPRIRRRGRRARSRSSSMTSTGSTRGSKTRASLCSLRRPTGRGASGRCTSPTRTGTWWSSRGPNNLSDRATAAASSSRGRRRVDQAASASSSSRRPPRQRTTQSRCPCWMPVAGSSSNAP